MTTKESEVDVLAAMRSGAKRLRLGVEGPITADLLDQSAAAVAEVFEALQGALKTAEFEKHPFRPWHARARTALRNAGVKL